MALVRHPKKLVRPGQWVLAKVPDHLRESSYDFEHHDTAYICIVPEYGPIHDSESGFRWWYYINWRFPHTEPQEGERYKWYWTHNTQYRVKDKDPEATWRDGSYRYMIQYDFGLIEYNGGDWRQPGPYDEEESSKKYSGKGGFLYDPASDDPEECPGGDYSIYFCDQCQKFVIPWSDDEGNLVCSGCSPLTGMIYDEKTADQIERARALANFVGPECRNHLEQCINYLGMREAWNRLSRCYLHTEDQFSFYFVLASYDDGKWVRGMNGGLIMHGPHVEILPDGTYKFTTWDYGLKCSRPATEAEIRNISWSTHT